MCLVQSQDLICVLHIFDLVRDISRYMNSIHLISISMFFRDILQRVADVMFIFGFMHLADAIAVRYGFHNNFMHLKSDVDKLQSTTIYWILQAVTGGVLRGAGKQLVGALCNLVGFYFIGFPIGVSLMFAANMGIVGENRTIMSCNYDIVLSPVSHETFRKAVKTLFHFCYRTMDRINRMCANAINFLHRFSVQT